MHRGKQNEPNITDPYRGPVIALLAIALAGAVGAIWEGLALYDPVLFAVALALGLGGGILAGVACAQEIRLRQSEAPRSETASPPAAQSQGALGFAPALEAIREDEASEAIVASEDEAQDAAEIRPRVAEQLRSGITAVSSRVAASYRAEGTLWRILFAPPTVCVR